MLFFFLQEATALDQLIKTVQRLRRLPKVTVAEPTLVLVGMPNVGKSSIVTGTHSPFSTPPP